MGTSQSQSRARTSVSASDYDFFERQSRPPVGTRQVGQAVVPNQTAEPAVTNPGSLKAAQIIRIGRQIERLRRQSASNNGAQARFRRAWIFRTGSNKPTPATASPRELIRREARVGTMVFGRVPAGHDRQFYCLDADTWVWYEAWTDSGGYQQAIVTRYEIRGNVVLKTQGRRNPEKLSGTELTNFADAVKSYYRLIASTVYPRQPGA